MELSVRCYNVSVSYDKFIKRKFRTLPITHEDNLQGLIKKQCILLNRILPYQENFMNTREEFSTVSFR